MTVLAMNSQMVSECLYLVLYFSTHLLWFDQLIPKLLFLDCLVLVPSNLELIVDLFGQSIEDEREYFIAIAWQHKLYEPYQVSLLFIQN